jgi:hypothetical protein
MVFVRRRKRTTSCKFYGIELLSLKVSMLSTYVGVVYGHTYLLFTRFLPVFQRRYGLDMDGIGLKYIGLSIGTTTAVRSLVGQLLPLSGRSMYKARAPLSLYFSSTARGYERFKVST